MNVSQKMNNSFSEYISEDLQEDGQKFARNKLLLNQPERQAVYNI